MTVPSFRDIPEQEYEVTPLELFFDLVFVFAVSQLSQHLLAHLSWRGAAETLVMLLAIFAVWFTTSWSATIIPADQSRTRWMMLAVMLLGLFMNASVTRAFTTSGWAFVIPLLLIQLGRAVWTLVNSTDALFRDHYFRVLLWLSTTTPLWIAGATVSPEARVLWWALAAGLDLLGRWLAHPIPGRRLRSENVDFDADHMLERCRLFLLIALGETVFTTGMAIAAASMTLMTLVTGTVALAGTVALWALGYGRSHRLTLQHVEETRDPIRAARHAVNALMAMVAGLVAVAVANEMVISQPREHASLSLSLLLGGGPILFLAAQGWYLWAVPNVRSQLHLIGGVALLLVGLATLAVPPYVALILVGASLTTLAILDRQMTKQKGNQVEEFRKMEIKRSGSQPSGEGPAGYFTGTVRIDPLFEAPDPARARGASVTFEPGARTAWHTHPLGQTLIVTAGRGLAQRWGGPVEQIRPGDVIWFPPGEKHWHGAATTTAMTHIAIQEQLDSKTADWMEKVSDEQYQTGLKAE